MSCRALDEVDSAATRALASGSAPSIVASLEPSRLERREELLALHQMTLDAMAHGVCMFDAEQCVVLLNKQYVAMFDFPPKVVQPGTSLRAMLEYLAEQDGLPAKSIDQMWRAHCARITLGNPFTLRRQRAGGRTIAIHFRPADGGGWICVCEDVSRYMRMEFELRKQVELLDQTIANIPQGLCMYGPDARLIICNDHYLSMYGLERSIIRPGCTLREDIERRRNTGSFTGDVEGYCAEITDAAAQGKAASRLLETAGGQMIHIIQRPMAGGGWVTTHEDVTESRRIYDDLCRSKHVVDSTLEHMDQGISIVDNNLTMLATNRRFRELLGFPEELCRPQANFADFIRYNAQRGEYGPGCPEEQVRSRVELARRFEPHVFERERPDGTILEIRGTPLPGGGFVTIYSDVTKRVRAEREAHAAHERLREAFEVVPEALALFDAEDRYVLWNRKYGELYRDKIDLCVGMPFEQLLRTGLAQGLYPAAKGREETWLAERLAHHRQPESRHEQQLPNGHWVQIQERRTADGGSVGIRVDITELKRREDSLKLLFDSNPVPMFVFDIETLRFLAVNDMAIQRYGYSREQFMAMTGLDIRPPDDRGQFATKIQAPHGEVSAARWRHQRADGTVIDVEVYSREIVYQGRAARFVSAIDVTERVRAEQERDRSWEFLNRIIDTIPITIVVKDPRDLRYVLINRNGEEAYGLTREKVIGRTADEIFPKAIADSITANDRRLVDSNESEFNMGEIELQTPNNGTRLITSRRLMIRRPDGAPQYLVDVIQDVTERRAIERQLQHAQKMEAVGNLTGGLAHDFNNLLTIIIGNLDLLQSEVAGNRIGEQRVETILQASERGADLTRQLLAFSRRQPLQPKQVEINALVDNTTRLMTRTLGETITVELRAATDLGVVRVDEAQLEAALVNIAINARDAMPGGGRLLIETRNAHLDADYAAQHAEVNAGDYVVIEISDTGTGMPPEVLARIFDPFFTTKGQGKGTGLGLSMVYGFVKQSGGHITAYSEVGKGTTFKLYLPRAERMEDRKSRAGSDPLATEPVDGAILVVDDNAEVRAAVVAQLTEMGYRVLEADSPLTALGVLGGGAEVDLLFTDIMMPGGITGKELAEMVRADHPHLKVLFTSGFPRAFFEKDAELTLGGALLNKPYRKADLAKAVRNMLQHR